ncbi:hypothetical protein Syun_028437 [Stephania yunnanensis]|uniref:Uncharacterized protein n=1 Tax=Stephania yunnanensis TaxID=152371 RepID=A0AAP0HR45_9MAGN
MNGLLFFWQCLLVMLLENHHSLNMKRTAMKFIQISSMPVDENIALKKNLKLKVKLPQPKSQVENITVKKKLKLKVKSPRAKWSEEEKSDLVYKDRDLMEISKRKSPPKLHGHLRRLGLLCENKDDGEIASEIHIFTSSCFKSNVIGKFANNGGGTCGQDSSLQDPNNNNINPKCESATSKRLGNPAAAYPKGVECLKTCEGQLSPSKSLLAAMLKKKARIDAHVKAVKEEAALKLLRQRQAARLALEEMEKSIDVYDSFVIMKDLEMMGVAKCIGHDRVLEGLGLYLKNEFPEDDDDDVEEGEIVYVKLTFSNAMKYNPSTNWVHELAGEFSRMFTLEWKSLEAKWSEEEKSDLVYKDQGLMEISKRKLPPKLHGHLRRIGLLCENKDDGETASEIQIFTIVAKQVTHVFAMSKSRFETRFLKHNEKTLSTGERVDPLKVKQEERERFEKKQREEKARIDAHVKAAEEEVALKLLRQKQAARLALEEE